MKKVFFLAAISLTGCAKISDYQTSCEQRFSRLSDVATCLDSSVKNDSRMSSAAEPKLYVLAARMLGQKVDNGEISDIQARIELQNFYISLQKQEQANQMAQSQAIQQALLNAQAVNTLQSIEQKNRQPTYVPPAPLHNNNVTTNCYTFGNQTQCRSY
ncbi:hypothetical protein [Pantoea sp. FN0305]|uniref:hypothetical protein n=1 Tax=Pantoea sp. FN0305 TaxID=3418559 RepID=UPI003CF82F4C